MSLSPFLPRLPGRSWATLLWGLALAGMAFALSKGPHAAVAAAAPLCAYTLWCAINTAFAVHKPRAFVQRAWRGMLAIPLIWAAAMSFPVAPWHPLHTPTSTNMTAFFLPALGAAGGLMWLGGLLWRSPIGRRLWARLWPAYDGEARLAHHVALACVEEGFDPPTVRVHLTQGGDNLSLESLDGTDPKIDQALARATRRFHLESTDQVWPASWILEESPGSMTDSLQKMQLAMRNDRTTAAIPGKTLSAHQRLAILSQG